MCRENSRFIKVWKRITVTLHGYLCTSMIISPWILLRMRNFSDKSCIGNQNAHFVLKHVFLKIVSLWDSVEKHRIHCWVFTAAVVKRTHHNVVLPLCLSYFFSLSYGHYDSWILFRMHNAILIRVFSYIT